MKKERITDVLQEFKTSHSASLSCNVTLMMENVRKRCTTPPDEELRRQMLRDASFRIFVYLVLETLAAVDANASMCVLGTKGYLPPDYDAKRSRVSAFHAAMVAIPGAGDFYFDMAGAGGTTVAFNSGKSLTIACEMWPLSDIISVNLSSQPAIPRSAFPSTSVPSSSDTEDADRRKVLDDFAGQVHDRIDTFFSTFPTDKISVEEKDVLKNHVLERHGRAYRGMNDTKNLQQSPGVKVDATFLTKVYFKFDMQVSVSYRNDDGESIRAIAEQRLRTLLSSDFKMERYMTEVNNMSPVWWNWALPDYHGPVEIIRIEILVTVNARLLGLKEGIGNFTPEQKQMMLNNMSKVVLDMRMIWARLGKTEIAVFQDSVEIDRVPAVSALLHAPSICHNQANSLRQQPQSSSTAPAAIELTELAEGYIRTNTPSSNQALSSLLETPDGSKVNMDFLVGVAKIWDNKVAQAMLFAFSDYDEQASHTTPAAIVHEPTPSPVRANLLRPFYKRPEYQHTEYLRTLKVGAEGQPEEVDPDASRAVTQTRQAVAKNMANGVVTRYLELVEAYRGQMGARPYAAVFLETSPKDKLINQIMPLLNDYMDVNLLNTFSSRFYFNSDREKTICETIDGFSSKLFSLKGHLENFRELKNATDKVDSFFGLKISDKAETVGDFQQRICYPDFTAQEIIECLADTTIAVFYTYQTPQIQSSATSTPVTSQMTMHGLRSVSAERINNAASVCDLGRPGLT